MTNEELVSNIQAGINVQEYMGLLFEQNRKYIYKIAVHYSNVAEIDDLMQEGYFGLEKAVKGYRSEFGTAFITYAGYWIEQAMKRYIQNMGRTKRIPIHVLDNISKYQRFRADYHAITGVDPTDDEFCIFLEMSKKQLINLRKYIYEADAISLDGPIFGSEDISIGDLIPDQYNLEETVIDDIATAEGKQRLWKAVDDLGGRYATIIRGEFQNNQSLKLTASQLGVSAERVRVLKKKAIQLLKRDKRVQELAEVFGYDSGRAYHWGVNRFSNTNTSSTEYLALKHVEFEDSRKDMALHAQEISGVLGLSAKRMKHINSELQKAQELNNELKLLLHSIKQSSSKDSEKDA